VISFGLVNMDNGGGRSGGEECSRLLPAVEVRVMSQASLCGICGARKDEGGEKICTMYSVKSINKQVHRG
jgi:hypothetical protein